MLRQADGRNDNLSPRFRSNTLQTGETQDIDRDACQHPAGGKGIAAVFLLFRVVG